MTEKGGANTSLERFLANMEYGPADQVPNYELGVWSHTQERWENEGLPPWTFSWDWFTGEAYFGMDYREFIPMNFGMMPPFEHQVLEKTDRYEIVQHPHGVVTKALIEGTVRGMRSTMDTYLRFPVETLDDFRDLKKRYEANLPRRLPPYWQDRIPGWQHREHVLVLGQNCAAAGFYWRAREWMGTENVSYAWYDQPALMHEMMAFFADYTMEVCRPILERVDVEYFNLNEDLSMKTGPLLSPSTFKEFIYPHLKRLIAFFKSHGTRYIILDTDGNCELLIPMFMDAGVDCIWPLERASDMDPVRLRRKFGKQLRLWGGVDKRELAKGPAAIDSHLRAMAPLVEEGGFIPTVDHTVPPDVSWDNVCHYMKRKRALLSGAERTGL